MTGLWAGYIWGEHGSHTVNWPTPTNVLVDAALHQFESPIGKRNQATVWIRSVTVREPGGRIVEKPSPATVPMRFEAGAVGVTYGINTTAGVEAEGLVHAYAWP